MKQLILLLGLLFLIGCNVPDDVAQAEIETDETPDTPTETDEPTAQENEAETSESQDAMDKEDMEKTEEGDLVQASLLESKPIDFSTSTFSFEGFAPGKSHTGTFSEIAGKLFYDEGAIVGMEGTVQAASVDTGIGGLDAHLKNDDFFDVEKYPEISFISASIADGSMTGDLSFHGVTKEVSFPVDVTTTSVSADFLLDSTPFGMKHVGVDKNVRIKFSFVAE